MARQLKDTAARQLRELPRVHLIPVDDKTKDANTRKREIHTILALMFANLHKRGRPAKGIQGNRVYDV